MLKVAIVRDPNNLFVVLIQAPPPGRLTSAAPASLQRAALQPPGNPFTASSSFHNRARSSRLERAALTP